MSRVLTAYERQLLKDTLHGALGGRNGTTCGPARAERYEALMRLVRDGYMTGGHSCAMTGADIRYFYVSDAGRDEVEQ